MPKIQGSQRDFSAGELDVAMKRADENPIMKAGARQCANLRILNSKAVQNRPGKSALFLESGRVDEVLMSPGNKFFLVFGAGTLRVYSSSGVQVFTQGGFNWTAITANSVVWAVYQLSIYICFAGQQPQVLSWDGVSTWSVIPYAEQVSPGGQKRTAFYRIAPKGITMNVSAQVGAGVTVSLGTGYFTAGMVGTRVRYINRQILLTGFTNSGIMTGTIEESLPGSQFINFAIDPTTIFNLGDLIVGSVSGAQGYVVTIDAGGKRIGVQLMSAAATGVQSPAATQQQNVTQTAAYGFVATDIAVGPGGAVAAISVGAIGNPNFVPFWDQEVMNSFQGWPASCFVDQNRLGFCNFPSVPGGIAWSAIGAPTDIFPDAFPQSGIFELVPGKSQVLYVVPGMEGSEFAVCDNAIYYIPITANNPLKPGSVAFNQLSGQGAATVQPQRAEQTIVYVKSGGTQIGAIQVPGTYNRPYVVDNISELHAHLFNAPTAIAIPSGSTQFEETYLYVLNGDGTLVVGKYLMKNGLLDAGPDGKPHVGWTPWSGIGTVKWVAALGSDVVFTTSYAPNGVTAVSVVETLDNTQYLDGALSVNSLPTPFAPPGGKGPLYVFPGPGATVTLIDQGYRMMGTYTVDANGFIVPQNNGGENLNAATLVAGQPWTATLEPFVPDAPPGGQDVHQRMQPRRVSRMATYVSNSTGFLQARLFSGKQTPTSPLLGTVMNNRRVTAWNQDDDPTKPPPLREEAQRWRPIGRSFDPRVAIIKDTPGPLVIHEIAMEATG